MKFPALVPKAFDSPALSAPTVVNERDVKPVVIFPNGGGTTKLLLTEENAGCRYANLGLFMADPGQGSQWHTHPVEGQGTMFYKQGGREHQLPFKERGAIFTGHLTHHVRNTGSKPLKIYFSIAPLPARTIIHGVQNDDERGHIDSVDLRPPQLICPGDIAITPFTAGGLTNRNMLTPDTVGARHGRFGTALETPGTGSFWHTHPADVGEEDLFYTIRGEGMMVYLHGGKVHSFEFHAGDAFHSHHLTNFTRNHSDADLEMVYSGAPHPPNTIVHTLA